MSIGNSWAANSWTSAAWAANSWQNWTVEASTAGMYLIIDADGNVEVKYCTKVKQLGTA